LSETAFERSIRCPFCAANIVVALEDVVEGLPKPEFIIGFQVTREQARELFRRWLRDNHWFRPGDLAQAAIEDRQRGVYLPFWAFVSRAQSRWRAQIGEHWSETRTYTTTDSEGRTQTRTETIRHTEWWPLAGEHHDYYSGYLVSASRGLPQTEALSLMPFRLHALTRYRPWYLAGWLSEEPGLDKELARRQCEAEFRRREQEAIAKFLPGDTYQQLLVATELEVLDSDLILLPVHVLSYRYGGQLYRILINGQTGSFVGQKPLSAKRISVAVVVILLLIAVLVAGALWLGRVR